MRIRRKPDASYPGNPRDPRRKAYVVPKPAATSLDAAKRKTILETVRSEKRRVYQSATVRDICDVPEFSHHRPISFEGIDWERRLACKVDPALFLRTYFPNVFSLPWSEVHIRLISAIQDRITHGGRKILACPRRFGKTAICRGMVMYSMLYGLRSFPFFIGSREDNACQTLEFIKVQLHRNQLLQQDFPEFCYPIYRLEGRSGVGNQGQLYKGERTYIRWSAKEIQLPCLMLDEDDVSCYMAHDPAAVMALPDTDRFLIRGSGCLVRVSGIDGSIRGEADIHPVLLTQPRPDLILLDDIVKDHKADSPKAIEDMCALIESAISYLAAPGISQATVWPGTVIQENDPTDRYLNPAMKPEWNGERTALITQYPPGITDESISLDTVQGQLWLKYDEIRRQSYRERGNLSLANAFFREHQQVMEEGFVVSWDALHITSSSDPDYNEVSAVQAAMNRRFEDLTSFLSECQNRPRTRTKSSVFALTPEQIISKTTVIPRNELAVDWDIVAAFIDVQDEILFYTILACNHDFTGQFIDYGTFPQVHTSYFRKSATASWSLLSRLFRTAHPHVAMESAQRAPFEAKIYFALKQCCDWLLSREFQYISEPPTTARIQGIGIDTRWGLANDTVKRFIREYNNPRVLPYMGHAFLPSHKQLEEYEMRPGWLFEHTLHPHVRESTWAIKPPTSNNPQRHIMADANRLKSNLVKRIAAPAGSPGSITLFDDPVNNHRMFADHLTAEYPEEITARGLRKDCWQVYAEKRDDNDYLDCAVGCLCLASILGASVKTSSEPLPKEPKRPSIRERYRLRRVNRRR